MSNKIISKQNNTNKGKLSNKQNHKFGVIGFTCLVILLLLSYVAFLANSKNSKSESKSLIKKFNDSYESTTMNVVMYYNSKNVESKLVDMEKQYLSLLSRTYNFEYVMIDSSLLNSKDKNSIEEKLGVDNSDFIISIVKNKKIISISDKYIESHNLVKLFINSNLLPKDATYKYIDNLKFIDYEEYKDLLDEKNKNIIVIGQSGCQYCNAIKPILNNISKAYKVDIYYLDVSDVDKKDLQEFFEKLPSIGYDDEALEEEGSFSMPTVFITKKGEIKSYLAGEKELEEYISYFKKNEVIE